MTQSNTAAANEAPRDAPRDAARDTVIVVKDVTTAFGSHVVHEHLNMTVCKGEIVAIVGGSGSGKTTLLRAILGLQDFRHGSIDVFGEPIASYQGAARIALTRRWGMLFQSGALFSALPVYDNIALPLREVRTLPESLIKEVVMMRLAWVGLSPADATLMPSGLSGGMIKRVALARALSLDPELLFLDEPTAGLDPQRADEFVSLIKALHSQLGFTVIMVTHDLDTIRDLATRVAVLADKKVLAEGTIEAVMQIDHPFIEAFFHGERGKRAMGEAEKPLNRDQETNPQPDGK